MNIKKHKHVIPLMFHISKLAEKSLHINFPFFMFCHAAFIYCKTCI